MTQGEFGAVAVSLIVGLTDVARVMKQRSHDAENGALRTKALVDQVRAVVAHD